MSEEDFERMLDAMPRIAEALKDIPDDLKQRAFDVLVATIPGVPLQRTAPVEGQVASSDTPEDGGSEPAASVSQGRSPKGPKGRRATTSRKPSARKTWAPDRHIDFWPEGKQSFAAFVEEKQPTSLHQKNLLAVFWLEQVAEIAEIGVGQVLAAFKAIDWNEPPDLHAALRRTGSEEHWIDTRSTKAMTTTPGGRNMVKSMPLPKGKK